MKIIKRHVIKIEEEFNWKRVFNFLCIFLIASNLFIIILSWIANPNSIEGDAHRIYCAAETVYFDYSQNPYFINNTIVYSNTTKPFIYPPITLIFFKIICPLNFINIQLILGIAILVLSYFLIRKYDKDFQWLFYLTLLLSAFNGVRWALRTGQAVYYEFLFLLLAYIAIFCNRYNLIAISISLIGIFKLLPIVFSSLLLFVKSKKLLGIKLFTLSIGLFAFILILSNILFPQISTSFYQQITGKIPGQVTPWTDGGDFDNQDLMHIVKSIAGILSPSIYLFFIFYFIFISIIALFFIKFAKTKSDFLDIFSFGSLGILIILPRLQVYTYLLTILPLYFLTKNYSIKDKIFILMVAGVWPFFSWVIYHFAFFHKLFNSSLFPPYLYALIFIYFYIYFKQKNSPSPTFKS